MVTMTKRRAPLLMTAASGFLAAALAATPLVLDRASSLEAVPAASPAAVDTPAASPSTEPSAAAADRTEQEQVSRDVERPALAQVADERAAAQAQTLQAISTEGERLAAQQKAEQEAAARAAAEQKAQQEAAAAAAEKASGGYSGEPREIARQMMAAEYGWGEQQFQCYDNIIMRESEWIVTADNPTSDAYGIPQALPGSKMASAGADWQTNPVTQIRWGLGYVAERYDTPCEAWSFKQAKGWY